ncbi:MAG TPA: LicD family protein [Clostridiales bacterium]|nr:LicD family protein [Clostridiales bacterium]
MAKLAIPEEQVKEMQQKGLEMVLFFDRFCTEHQLTYFLCGGCCIGAVRTGGFIPWDDDVDVFMPRKDYETLKRIWLDTEQYSIQYPTKTFLTENQFLTICDNNTTFIKTYQKDLDINHGVQLDVLPLDGCPKGWRRKVQKLEALLYSLFIVGKAPENHGKGTYLLGKTALALVPFQTERYYLWRFFEKQMSKYKIEDCELITELCSGPYYMQKEYPKSAFAYPVRRSFEGYELPIPVGYDTYLTMAFGDYMTLPPEEKRVCHHEYEYMDMNKSYKEYRGIWYLTKK